MDVTGSPDGVGVSPLRAFLVAEDLEELAGIAAAMDIADLDVADLLAVELVLQDWDDLQALSNLLMYPELMSREERITLLRKGLDDERTYLQLAAMVGLMEQDATRVPDDARSEIVRRLTDLVASDDGIVADRSSFVLGKYLRQVDCSDAVELLDHRSPTVRRNIVQGILHAAGPATLASLLDEPGFVSAERQDAARRQLAADGVTLTGSAKDVAQPMILTYLPSLREWLERYERGL